MNNNILKNNRIDPVSIVYRLDIRTPNQIRSAGGFFPHTPGLNAQTIHDLTYHFCEYINDNNDVSGFVSTTSQFGVVIDHASILSKENNFSSYGLPIFNKNFEAYIYEIRPDTLFYDLKQSLQVAMNQADAVGNTDRVNRINSLMFYLWMHEYISHGGFKMDRVIRYTKITEAILQKNDIKELSNVDFWNNKWTENSGNELPYNSAYDNDSSSPIAYPYEMISNPNGVLRRLTNPDITSTLENSVRDYIWLDFLYPDSEGSSSHKIPKNLKIKTIFTDSEYYIRSSIDHSAVVDLSKKESGANVYIYEDFNLSKQKWKLYYEKTRDAYKIVNSQNESLVLTWNSKLDNNVMGFEFHNYRDQFWIIEETENGFYMLRNVYNWLKVLDLENLSTANKTKIQVHIENNTNTQKWKITSGELAVLPDGEYQIKSSIDQNVLVDLSDNRSEAKVCIYENLNQSSQKWKFSYDYLRRSYKIVSSQNEELVLTWNRIEDNSTIGFESQSFEEQFWMIEKTKDGFYILRNYYNPKMVLDLADLSTKNGNNILAYKENNGKNQKWSIDRVDKPTLLDGIYIISTLLDYKKAIDYDYPFDQNLIIHDNLNFITDEFKIEYNPEKQAYKIRLTEDNDYGIIFQSKDGSLKINNIDNTDLGLRVYWLIEYNHDGGGYIIRSAYDPTQVLDLKDSNLTDGTEIISYAVHFGKNQIWNFILKNDI